MPPEQIPNLPYAAAMIALFAILIALERRQPRFALSTWLVGLALVFGGQLSGYFMTAPTTYRFGHIFHLACDLLAGVVFLVYTGRPFSRPEHIPSPALLNAFPLLAVVVLYGLDVTSRTPFLLCSLALGLFALLTAIQLPRLRRFAAAQGCLAAVLLVFTFTMQWRAAAYWALGSVYLAAAVHQWLVLRSRSLGRITIGASLAIWALCFFTHPWLLHAPNIGPAAENLWAMQKYFLTLGMLLTLLENHASENEHLAHHDELTGLANRRRARQFLQTGVERGQVHLVLLDLNGFKSVNDTHGHAAGDQLLRIVAERLSATIKPGDRLARLGGDEFVVVTPHAPERLVEEIAHAIAQPVHLGAAVVRVSASIGFASFPADPMLGTSQEIASQLLRLADQRMYRNKTRENDASWSTALQSR